MGWDGTCLAQAVTSCVRCLACSRAAHSSSCTPSLSSLSSLSKSLSVDIHVRQGCDAGRARTGSRGSVASGGCPRCPALVPVRHRWMSTPPLGRRSCLLGRWHSEDIARGREPET